MAGVEVVMTEQGHERVDKLFKIGGELLWVTASIQPSSKRAKLSWIAYEPTSSDYDLSSPDDGEG